MDKAVEFLREKGMAAAEKKAGRIAAEGAIFSYIHNGGRIGVLLEVNCETDFVAREDSFNQFGKDIAMHIAACNPLYIKEEDIPAEVLEKDPASTPAGMAIMPNISPLKKKGRSSLVMSWVTRGMQITFTPTTEPTSMPPKPAPSGVRQSSLAKG